MTRRKKRQSRKKTAEAPKPKGPTSIMGYELGQEVFVRMHAPVGLISHGSILSFHTGSSGPVCFSFWDDINGKFRTTAVENIIDNPDSKITRKLSRQRSSGKRKKN